MNLTGITYAGTSTRNRLGMSRFVEDIVGLTPQPVAGMTADRFPLPDGSVLAVAGAGEMGATVRSLGFMVDDIEQAAIELRAAGIEVDEQIAGNERQHYLHFRAPDGELYELVADIDAAPAPQGVSDGALLSPDASAHPLGPSGPAGVEVLDGAPVAALASLGRLGAVEVGIWEMTPGTVRDVEGHEIFIVLSGRATVTLADARQVELGPGSVVQFPAGERTRWTVHETLRKIYIS